MMSGAASPPHPSPLPKGEGGPLAVGEGLAGKV
jgi:hypothetical protein